MSNRGAGLRWLSTLVLVLVGCATPVERISSADANDASLALPAGAPAILERRLLAMDWPKTVRVNDSEVIRLAIQMDDRGSRIPNAGSVDLYATHNVVAAARLETIGLEAYREEIRQPMRPGQPVTFRWSIQANQAGEQRATVWLKLELVPKDGGPMEEVLLLARPIDIQAVTIVGLAGPTARILGGLLAAVSLLLVASLLWSLPRSRLSKSDRPKSTAGIGGPASENE